jgi:hypothetical protein
MAYTERVYSKEEIEAYNLNYFLLRNEEDKYFNYINELGYFPMLYDESMVNWSLTYSMYNNLYEIFKYIINTNTFQSSSLLYEFSDTIYNQFERLNNFDNTFLFIYNKYILKIDKENYKILQRFVLVCMEYIINYKKEPTGIYSSYILNNLIIKYNIDIIIKGQYRRLIDPLQLKELKKEQLIQESNKIKEKWMKCKNIKNELIKYIDKYIVNVIILPFI